MLNFRSIIILLTFYFSAAYTVYWGLTENFGYIRILSDKPIDVQIDSEKVICDGFPCRIKIRPNIYNVSLVGDGDFKRQFKVNIKRGRLAKIEYIPKKNIIVEQVENSQLKPVFETEVLEKFTNVYFKNKLIHRFNSATEDVAYSVLSSLETGLIYSPNLQQVYRVDLKKNSARIEKVTEEFKSISLFEPGKVLIETSSGFFKQENNIIAPFAYSPNSILKFDQESELIVTTNDFNNSNSNARSLDSIVENFDLFKQDIFLFLHNKTTGEYNKLLTMKDIDPIDVKLSRKFFENELKTVLQTKTKSFIIDSN